MDFYILLNLAAFVASVVLALSHLGLVILLFLYLARRRKIQSRKARSSGSVTRSHQPTSSGSFFSFFGSDDEPDITTFATHDIPRSGLFSAHERRMEYRRRGKSPSGVIDGVYNDMYRENGRAYSDMDRDWDADA